MPQKLADGKVKAVRNMEESFEVMEADLPALVTVAQEINEPRLPKFMAIRKAGAKPRHEWGPDDLGLAADEVGQNALSVETLSNLAPEQDRKNIIRIEYVEPNTRMAWFLMQTQLLGINLVTTPPIGKYFGQRKSFNGVFHNFLSRIS